MLAAGLLAKKAVERGLTVKPYVKTSLAPGSRVVTDYYRKTGLDTALDKLGFNARRLRLHDLYRQQRPAAGAGGRGASAEGNLVAAAVLSGNRNFEGRINPHVKANYLASPPLVVAYALAGTRRYRSGHRAAGHGQRRQAGLPERHLAVAGGSEARSWPTRSRAEMFRKRYENVFEANPTWNALPVTPSELYPLGRQEHLRPGAAVLARPGRRAESHPAAPRGAGAGGLGRFGHHRPHLARRLDRGHAARPESISRSTA